MEHSQETPWKMDTSIVGGGRRENARKRNGKREGRKEGKGDDEMTFSTKKDLPS